MKTHQQIKSLEYEASLIGSKELAESKNTEVADKESKLQKIVMVCVLDVYQFFQTSQGPKLDNSWPIMATWWKRKRSPK